MYSEAFAFIEIKSNNMLTCYSRNFFFSCKGITCNVMSYVKEQLLVIQILFHKQDERLSWFFKILQYGIKLAIMISCASLLKTISFEFVFLFSFEVLIRNQSLVNKKQVLLHKFMLTFQQYCGQGCRREIFALGRVLILIFSSVGQFLEFLMEMG